MGYCIHLGEVERLKSERMVPQREVQIRPDSCRMAIEHKARLDEKEDWETVVVSCLEEEQIVEILLVSSAVEKRVSEVPTEASDTVVVVAP